MTRRLAAALALSLAGCAATPALPPLPSGHPASPDAQETPTLVRESVLGAGGTRAAPSALPHGDTHSDSERPGRVERSRP